MYHEPVLLKESIDELITQDDGWYVDLTMGGGGHTIEILNRIKKAKLLAFDQDPDAINQIPEDNRLKFIPSNFRYLEQWLGYLGLGKVSGVLADLGVSTFQIDEKSRGFTYRQDGVLDMRMDKERELTAEVVLNEYSKEDLQVILSEYGEVRNAATLARAIVEARKYGGIYTVDDLLAILETRVVGKRMRYISQVFQAIRIEVNDEIGALKDMLLSLVNVIRPGGRVVVLSYHSLEDRIVKDFLRKGIVERKRDNPMAEQKDRPFKMINKKVIVASAEEIKINPRARSVKMRIGEKI